VLVVLDNALDTEQVRPLLPGTPGCLALITSRNRLTDLVAVEGAVPITLDVLSDVETREFFLGRLGIERVAAEPTSVAEIGVHCARLPLALALVAARAAIHPRFPLATLAAELSASRDAPGALAAGESGNDVRATFSWSYRRLAPAAATLFRLVGLHPGADIETGAAASLAGVPVPAVRPLLAELARAHLVTEHVPGRFALHDLLRAYAAELARTEDTEADRRAAVRRLLDHYLRTAYHAALLIYPHRYQLDLVAAVPGTHHTELAGAEAASAWFTTEHAGLIGALDLAAGAGLATHAWQLASAMATYFHRRGHWHDWAATQHVALAAAERAADRAGQAHAHSSLGLAYDRLKRYDEAHTHLRRAYALLGELDDPIGQAYTHLRMSGLYESQGENPTALHHAEQALGLFRAAAHRTGHAQALNVVGWLHAQLGQYPEAIDHCGQAIVLHRELGDRAGVAHTLDSLGFAHHRLGHYREAVAHFQQALDVLSQLDDRYYESIALTHLGDSHRARGDRAAAGEAWQRAVEILDELGHPDAGPVHARLKELDASPERDV
jgi:tetratricopeptide (TPR) repeat protein